MRIRPLGHNVLVEPDDRPMELESGLVMPDSVDDPPQSGIVMSTANGPYRDRMLRNAVITRCLRMLDDAREQAVSRHELAELMRDSLLEYLQSHDSVESSVRPGDRVFFPPAAGYTVTLGDSRETVVTMLREDYVLGVVEPEE